MSLLEETMNAIYSLIDGSYPSTAPTLNDYGPGTAPNTKTNPVLGWTLIASAEDYFMQTSSTSEDYYGDFQFQFNAWSSKSSPQEAVRIIEAVKDLFRSNQNGMSLATGRVLDADIGITQTVEQVPPKDGWNANVVITFETGT